MFDDSDLRPDYPLIGDDSWRQVFAELGCSDTAILPTRPTDEEIWSRQAVVLARKGPTDHHELLACFVASGETPPDVATLRKHLGERLPQYMMPAAFYRIDRVP